MRRKGREMGGMWVRGNGFDFRLPCFAVVLVSACVWNDSITESDFHSIYLEDRILSFRWWHVPYFPMKLPLPPNEVGVSWDQQRVEHVDVLLSAAHGIGSHCISQVAVATRLFSGLYNFG